VYGVSRNAAPVFLITLPKWKMIHWWQFCVRDAVTKISTKLPICRHVTWRLSPQYLVKLKTTKTDTIYKVQHNDVVLETLVLVSRRLNERQLIVAIISHTNWGQIHLAQGSIVRTLLSNKNRDGSVLKPKLKPQFLAETECVSVVVGAIKTEIEIAEPTHP